MVYQWKNRIRMVYYSYPSDVDDCPHLVQWPKTFPMPRAWSKILDFRNEIIAVGKDNRENNRESYLDVLVKSEFSGAYHWIERSEDPKNPGLYPHLNNKDLNYEENDPGPTTEDLN